MTVSNPVAQEPGSATNSLSGLARVSRILFLVSAAIFAICVGLQVFIAGMAVFAGPQNWAMHVNFIHFFEFIPLLMLLFAFLGKMPASMKWVSGGQLLLIFYMYFAANIRGVNPLLAATHPVVAMVIFALSIWTVTRVWPLVLGKNR